MTFARPNPLQVLLLQAVLLKDAAAERAFADWRSQSDLFRLDPWSNGLISPLYANLGDKCIPAEVREVLKGNYRYHWTRNRLWQKKATELLQLLAAEGICPVIADDFRLAWGDYPEPAQRPLESLCLLLRESEVKEALLLLEKAGWIAGYQIQVETQNHCILNCDGAFSLQLEWRAFFEGIPHPMDREFRDRTLPFSFAGLDLLQLHPIDQFFRLSVRPQSPLRRIVDLRMLLRHPQWNWDDLVFIAHKQERCLSFRRDLGLLAGAAPEFLPADILSGLRPSLLERMEDFFVCQQNSKPSPALFLYARNKGSAGGKPGQAWLRVLFYSIFLAWQKVRRKVPGWARQAVKKTTRRLNFTAPWLHPRI